MSRGFYMSQERIEFLSAVLVISKKAEELAKFYKEVVGLPLETEDHGNLKKHYGCELGDLHFAIHPPENFEDQNSGVGAVRLAFTTFDIEKLATRITNAGFKLAYPPKNTGFAMMTAMHDPDGNYVEFTQLSDKWFKYLESRKAKGVDVVERWKSVKG